MLKRLTALALVLLAAVLAPPLAAAQTGLYDNFPDPLFDPEKWFGLEASLGAGASSNEILRRIVGTGAARAAQLLLRATGDTSSDAGSRAPNNRLRIAHPKIMAGTPIVKTVEAAMNVVGMTIDECPGNTGVAGRVRAQIVAAFFNDGTGSNRGGDRTGDVHAGVQKVFDTTLGNRVEAFINRCTDAACVVASLGSVAFTRSWVTNAVDVMRVTWLPDSNEFEFTVNGSEGNETVTLPYAVADVEKPKRIFHELVQSYTLPNCTAGAVQGFMDLRIDNVRLDQAAIDATH